MMFVLASAEPELHPAKDEYWDIFKYYNGIKPSPAT